VQDRRDLFQLDETPSMAEAAQLVHNQAALAEAQRLAIKEAQLAAKVPAKPRQSLTRQTARHRSGPSHDIGPSQ
jgi:hypothetical protein